MRATLPAMSPTVGLSWAMVMRSMNGALAVSGDVRRCRAVSDGDRLGQAEDLAQIGQIGFVVDRKSTRLNSSHLVISYAVFCLKKKTITITCMSLSPRHESTTPTTLLH